MGAYLSAPVTEKEYEKGETERIRFACASMQGWRTHQEDSHNCIPDFVDAPAQSKCSLFAVYDGHGGAEVAKYIAANFPAFLLDSGLREVLSPAAGSVAADPTAVMSSALKQGFISFDDALRSDEVVQKMTAIRDQENSSVKKKSGVAGRVGGKDSRVGGKDEEEEDERAAFFDEAIALSEESEMSLVSIIRQYAQIRRRLMQQGGGAVPGLRVVDEVGVDEERDEGVGEEVENERTWRLRARNATKRLHTSGREPFSSSSPSHSDGEDVAQKRRKTMLQRENATSGSSDEGAECTTKNEATGSELLNGEGQTNGAVCPADTPAAKESAKKEEQGIKEEACMNGANKDGVEHLDSSEKIQKKSTQPGSHPKLPFADEIAPGHSAGDSNGSAEEMPNGGHESISSQLPLTPKKPPVDLASESDSISQPGPSSARKSEDADQCDDDDEEDSEDEDFDVDKEDEGVTTTDEGTDDESGTSDGEEEEEQVGKKARYSWDSSNDEEEEEEEEGEVDGEEDEQMDEDEFEEMAEEEDEMGSKAGFDSGATACMALLFNDKVIVANVGDSRAVLARDGKAMDLSVDHKPEDEAERGRIEKAGGIVNSEGRVNGGLNLSRALGDHCYKQHEELPLEEQMITALPDIKVIDDLDPNKDQLLVLACDGIWNSMSSQQVVDFILERRSTKSLTEIGAELCHHCLAPDTSGDGTGCDNMTVIIVDLNKAAGVGEKEAAESGKTAKQEEGTASSELNREDTKSDP